MNPPRSEPIYLVRIVGDVIHTSACRYAKHPDAVRWRWADANPDEDWATTCPWLRPCLVCYPPSPFGGESA
jgi:hypothetical protein